MDLDLSNDLSGLPNLSNLSNLLASHGREHAREKIATGPAPSPAKKRRLRLDRLDRLDRGNDINGLDVSNLCSIHSSRLDRLDRLTISGFAVLTAV